MSREIEVVLIDIVKMVARVAMLIKERKVISASGVESKDILQEILNALPERKNAPNVIRRNTLQLCVKPRVKILANQK